MSSKYVRDMLRGWLSGATTPFYETINEEQDPTEDLWFTVQFNVESSDLTTYCEDKIEEGMIDLVFCGRPGIGDSAVIAAAETEASRVVASSDPAMKLVLRRALPPDEFSDGDGDPWYRVVIGIEYIYTA